MGLRVNITDPGKIVTKCKGVLFDDNLINSLHGLINIESFKNQPKEQQLQTTGIVYE